MANKTTFTTKQGATLIVPFAAELDEPSPDYTGWLVSFIVKADFSTPDINAIINTVNIALDPVSGQGSVTYAAATTINWKVGQYIYTAKVTDAAGNTALTDTGVFSIEATGFQGALS